MNQGIDPAGRSAASARVPPQTRSVLLISADEALIRQAGAALAAPCATLWQLTPAGTLETGIAALRRRSHDVVMLDLFLPDSSGAASYAALAAAAPLVPVLVLAARRHEELAWQLTRRGAQGHLLKDHLDAYWLPRHLRRALACKIDDDAAYEEKVRAQVTLDAIGDAVLSVDATGRVTFLNVVAEGMTGWMRGEALGRAATDVLPLVDGVTRAEALSPLARAMREDRIVELSVNAVLKARDGTELQIEDSAAPIHDRAGRVAGAVIVFRNISASHTIARKMLHLAQHDVLTDLPNRLLLQTRLDHAISSARRHDRGGAILFVDLDHFKAVNDSHGHRTGDLLLQQVAQRLLASVRASDTVSRLGGDEFVLLLDEIERPSDAAICAAKVSAAIAMPYQVEGITLKLSASIGIGLFPDDAHDPDALLRCADEAMYCAKAAGRNVVCFHHEDAARRRRPA